jgi:ABC-type enterobactin transport system permease subunit
MPKVLALWLMIMAGAGKGTFRWVARGICVLALVAALTDWRFVRYEDYDWPAHAARIRAGGPVNDIPINPHGSLFGYPGRR